MTLNDHALFHLCVLALLRLEIMLKCTTIVKVKVTRGRGPSVRRCLELAGSLTPPPVQTIELKDRLSATTPSSSLLNQTPASSYRKFTGSRITILH